MNTEQWRSKVSEKVLLERALMLKNIRAFFDGKGVLEVETPLLSQFATTDPHLESLQSRFRERNCYLNTSPEYAMKRLLAGSKRAIYQICKAFRDDELGVTHNPEFTMLEWYQPDYDEVKLMGELAELVTVLFADSEIRPKFVSMSYQQVFEDAIGLNPHEASSVQCHSLSIENNIEIPQGLTVDDDVNDWLDWLLTQKVLPLFAKDCFTFIYDYPATQCALAKIGTNAQQVSVAKRFELFFGEMELANGFHELTDAEEQMSRFQLENELRQQNGSDVVDIDANLIAALASGLPECAGVAVGLDRLLMVKAACTHIDQVLAFSWQNN